jgi:hypothetical protein
LTNEKGNKMKLNEKAMLVRLSISQWTARKHDRKVTQEVAQNHGTTANVGRYHKRLIAENEIKKIQRAANSMRIYHYQNTLPWEDGAIGARLLPSMNFMEYSQKMRELGREFDQAVSKFVANYSELVEQARIELNGLFRDEDYPPVEAIRSKFSWDIRIDPLPESNDFRVALADDELSEIRADIEKRVEASANTAMRDLWERLYGAVKHMVEKLREPELEEGRGPIFRNSLVGNISQLCELLPRLNISGDPNLEAMRREVEEKLAGYDPDELRNNPIVKNNAARDAEDILHRMEGYF